VSYRRMLYARQLVARLAAERRRRQAGLRASSPHAFPIVRSTRPEHWHAERRQQWPACLQSPLVRLTCMASVSAQDFWQIYFIVTQKDGVEGIEQQSLGSSWGIVSGDENEAGDAA
jgi:hypothetical protein